MSTCHTLRSNHGRRVGGGETARPRGYQARWKRHGRGQAGGRNSAEVKFVAGLTEVILCQTTVGGGGTLNKKMEVKFVAGRMDKWDGFSCHEPEKGW